MGNKSLRTKLVRVFKGWYILFMNHLRFFRYYSLIKKAAPDFIYERSSYLNYNGIIISKLLGIPHVYEVNGIGAKDNAGYFSSYWNSIALWLEKYAYRNTYGFYVGGINKELNISPQRSVSIQNGVDDEFCKLFLKREAIITDKINITFIGHAMAHHRLDVLLDALGQIKNPAGFRLHMIGSNLEKWKVHIPQDIDTLYYGSLSQERISGVIGGFHIGIITYSESYFSHVKVFMYGAAGLTVILPATRNFTRIFSENEVMFVNNGDAKDIADKLNLLEKQPDLLKKYGMNISEKVRREYTWEKLYENVAVKIRDRLLEKRVTQYQRT